MQTKSFGFQRQTARTQPPPQQTQQQLQPPQPQPQSQQPTVVDPNTTPKTLSMAPLPNGIPPPPQYFSFPPPPPIPTLGTPDLDLFAFHNVYQHIIAAKLYSENRIDMEHTLSKALLADVLGPDIEPELYPDLTNTGVVHPDKVKLTQKVQNPGPKHPTQTSDDLILTPLDQAIDSNKLFQPMPQSFKSKTTFYLEGPTLPKHNTIQTRPKQPAPYIAQSVNAGDYQQPIQHVAKKAAR